MGKKDQISEVFLAARSGFLIRQGFDCNYC